MTIAVIPARGGSKRILRKNIKPFLGKPMIFYAIRAALESRLFDLVVVSTDDAEIQAIAKGLGADVPFKRPVELSDDYTPTVPVIAHAVEFCEGLGWKGEYACCIYPCVPLLTPLDLQRSYHALVNANANYLYPVAEYVHPIQRGMRMSSDGKMEFLKPENEFVRTQDLEVVYHDVGQFYWGKVGAWRAGKAMHTNGIGFKVPNWRFVDIDEESDWERAESLFETLMNKQESVS